MNYTPDDWMLVLLIVNATIWTGVGVKWTIDVWRNR